MSLDTSTVIAASIREAVRELLARDPDALRTHVMLRTLQHRDMVPDETALRIAGEDFGVSLDAVEAARARIKGRSGASLVFVDLDHGTIDVWQQPIPQVTP